MYNIPDGTSSIYVSDKLFNSADLSMIKTTKEPPSQTLKITNLRKPWEVSERKIVLVVPMDNFFWVYLECV